MGMSDYIEKGNVLETPFGYTISVIGGKWKMLILYLLAENQIVRFNELKRKIGSITFKTLSAQLKELEADGMIIRKEYPQIPLKWNTVLHIKRKLYYLYWSNYVIGE